MATKKKEADGGQKEEEVGKSGGRLYENARSQLKPASANPFSKDSTSSAVKGDNDDDEGHVDKLLRQDSQRKMMQKQKARSPSRSSVGGIRKTRDDKLTRKRNNVLTTTHPTLKRAKCKYQIVDD